MNAAEPNYQQKDLSGYDDFVCVAREQLYSQDWAFRGQPRADWRLSPSLERTIESKKSLQVGAFVNERFEERVLLRQFKKRAFQYIIDTPDEDDDLEWLALMQHHGAPTRLLDWTLSPYVGLFFALAEAVPEQPTALWAVNTLALKQHAEVELQCSDPSYSSCPDDQNGQRLWFKRVFFPDHSPSAEASGPSVIMPVSPFRMNERLTIQQGLFLCANRNDLPFQSRLEDTMNKIGTRNGGATVGLFKLTISNGAKLQMLRELGRMNINYSTLFPGIDGLAKSLGTRAKISPPKHQSDRPAHGI